ncbi:Transcription factor ILR3 [Dendrobium catenatum]|uniref:Transcription factor ILR3 n=1 Tax=Dendrobium catenatum TaxID=906689 RepID=A0A2I0WMN2_9ASPA|nr:Transcription factor ILR3 [Dendrobium catenatum]
MASPENPNWLLDCPLIDDLSAPPANGFIWAPQEFNHQSKVRPPFSTHEGYVRCLAFGLLISTSLLSHCHMIGTHLFHLCHLPLNLIHFLSLFERRRTKAEKIELRDEKQRLKTEKESLEQQAKFLNAPRPSFIPHPSLIPTAFSAPGKNPGQKLMMPVMGYPGFPMWQFMHPSDVDTSQDAESCPPVA